MMNNYTSPKEHTYCTLALTVHAQINRGLDGCVMHLIMPCAKCKQHPFGGIEN